MTTPNNDASNKSKHKSEDDNNINNNRDTSDITYDHDHVDNFIMILMQLI